MDAIFAQSLSYCRIMNTVVLGSFMTSWMSRHCSLGVILVGRPLLGKVHPCSQFSPFVDNGSDRGSLESQSLRNLSFQMDTCQLFCLSCVQLCQTGSI